MKQASEPQTQQTQPNSPITSENAINEQTPLPYRIAAQSLVHCVGSTAWLLAHHRIHLPSEHVGMRVRFANGTSARVYRETVVDADSPRDPCALVVEFRLRFVRGRGHDLFRAESLLNTPLFVGFPGFVSKLWMTNDEHGFYRGIYEWDGPRRAEHYARCLWRVLALVSVRSSIHYIVLPGLHRDELLKDPHALVTTSEHDAAAWWRPIEAT